MPSRQWQSHVPDAYDALVELWTAALAGSPVLVKDSQWTSKEGVSGEQVICVGWSGFVAGYQFPSRSMSEEMGGADVTSEGIWQGLSPGIMETFSIACASIVRDGAAENLPAARRLAYANITTAASVITPPWLSGNVAKATFGSAVGLKQVQDRRGALAVVTFSVECVAYAQQ